MNRQPTWEDVQRYVQRWHQLKNQYGDQAVNVPEFTQLTKVIKFIQMQAMQRQGQQNQAANGVTPNPMQMQQPQQPPPQQAQAQAQAAQVQAQAQAQAQLQAQHQANALARPLPQQNFQHLAQRQRSFAHMQAPGMAPPQGSASAMGTPALASANAPLGAAPMMGVQGSPVNQSPHSVVSNTPSMQHQTPRVPQSFPQSGSMGAPAVKNGLPQDMSGAGESPFTPQQMQMLKLQNQAVKLLFRNPSGGLPPIPQPLIDIATNESLAYANNPAKPMPPSNIPAQLPAQSAGVMPNMRSPHVNAQQAPTPSSMRRSGPIPVQAPLQAGTPQQTVGTPQERPDSKRRLSRKPYQSNTPRQLSTSDSSYIQPVTRPPQAPVNFDDIKDDIDTSKQLVVPVSKPNVAVDAFELPQMIDFKSQNIDYNTLYSAQSKVKFPSTYPDGIDIDDIVSNRESLILLQIDARISNLREQLGKVSDDDEKNKLLVELTQLELLPYQKNIRGKLLSQVWFSKSLLPNSHPNFLAKFGSLSLENVVATEELYKQQLNSLLQAQNKKHQHQISKVLAYQSKKAYRMSGRKEKLERLLMRIQSFHNQTAKEEQKKVERMAKQRLQALKLNDEEAYLKLLDHTKDTRITHLLNQTNQFLDSLAQAVQSQQKATQERMDARNGEKDAEGAPGTEDKNEKVDYYHVAHRIKEEVTKQPSILIGGQLKEYQMKGLQWMVSLFNNHLNGILADEMGLGKTIQTISLLTYLVEMKNIPGPFLVIVPLSTLTNWNMEFEKWAPALRKITYKGTPVQRKVLQAEVKQGDFQVLLTTFEYVIKDRSLLSKVRWVHMIIDEGHRMKNTQSKLSETLTTFYHSDYRLILTGTPLQNNLPELWALLNFVLPKIFNSVKSFDDWFNTPFANTGGQDKIELSEEETLLVIRRLHKVLRPFLLRRLKKDVEKDLPNKVEKVVKCKMSSLQSKLYSMMLKYNALFAGDAVQGQKPSTIKNANNQLMQLRKICNHPFVYEEVENIINPLSETNDTIWRVAGKFELLDRILPKLKRTKHRVLIFFQMTQIMDIMEDYLRLRDLKFMRLDGGTKSDDRSELLRLFNDPDSEYFCFLLSTRAGGLGLNLQSADTVIIFDSDWNPHQDLQAQDRAHRIGQKNEVRILRFITESSIEEMILERAVAKLEIDGKVIQAGKFDNKSTAEEQEALLRALLEKEEERKQKGGEDDDEMDDDELNQVLARTENELELFKEMDEKRSMSMKEAGYPSRLFADQELPDIYRKDPEVFYKSEEQLIEEYGRGNRERKTTHYDDNMTEEEWLKKIEGYVSEESDGEIVPKKKGRPRKEEVERRKRAAIDDEPASKRPRSSTPSARGRGRRIGRPRTRGISSRSTPIVDTLEPDEREKLQNNMEAIYQALLDYRDGDRRLSDMFLVKPSKKLYPDYYVLIKHPLALDAVKKRKGNKTYTNIREFLEDIHLIFSNARIYNEEGSIVYQDATTLENLAIDKFREVYMDMDPEEKAKVLDFKEFDESNSLKPLVVGGQSAKEPLDAAAAPPAPAITGNGSDMGEPVRDDAGLGDLAPEPDADGENTNIFLEMPADMDEV